MHESASEEEKKLAAMYRLKFQEHSVDLKKARPTETRLDSCNALYLIDLRIMQRNCEAWQHCLGFDHESGLLFHASIALCVKWPSPHMDRHMVNTSCA